MTELQQYLQTRGFGVREEQERLYAYLIGADNSGVIAQAGTGVGKSAAIIAAAAHMSRKARTQSVIVTPTNMLASQYRDSEIPHARIAFPDLAFAEVRGKSHYYCEMTEKAMKLVGATYTGGCDGRDAGCTRREWGGHDAACFPQCDVDHDPEWECCYRMAIREASNADVVVTNADMLIVNDTILSNFNASFISMDGSLFVDEAHTLEGKLRDYASRSLNWKNVKAFPFADPSITGAVSKWLRAQEDSAEWEAVESSAPVWALSQLAEASVPDEATDGKGAERAQQLVESVQRILKFIDHPSDNAVLHVGDGSLKLDWVNISASANKLLTARRFGLVSATIPRSMAETLGIDDAKFIDAGHPFDYRRQAWLGFSCYSGSYQAAQSGENFEMRLQEVKALLKRSKGGALLLFSAFDDLTRCVEELEPWVREELGVKFLYQSRETSPEEREELAREFKADGNAILLGSSSFATGFDAPGNALRLGVLWKLPYPGQDPVTKRIQKISRRRYEDIMRVTAVQSIGRLIRTVDDKGIFWVADSRGRALIDTTDPMTSHLAQWNRM